MLVVFVLKNIENHQSFFVSFKIEHFKALFWWNIINRFNNKMKKKKLETFSHDPCM